MVFKSKQLRAPELNVLLLFTLSGSIVATVVRMVRPQKGRSEIDLQEPGVTLSNSYQNQIIETQRGEIERNGTT